MSHLEGLECALTIVVFVKKFACWAKGLGFPVATVHMGVQALLGAPGIFWAGRVECFGHMQQSSWCMGLEQADIRVHPCNRGDRLLVLPCLTRM